MITITKLLIFLAFICLNGIIALKCYSKSGGGAETQIECAADGDRCCTKICRRGVGKTFEVVKGCGDNFFECRKLFCRAFDEHSEQCVGDLCNEKDFKFVDCYEKEYMMRGSEFNKVNCPVDIGYSCFSQICNVFGMESEVKGCAKNCNEVCRGGIKESECNQCSTNLCNYSAATLANIFVLIFAVLMASILRLGLING